MDAVAKATGVYCPEAHGSDGSSSPESDDGVGVFHEVGEDLEAAEREALEFLVHLLCQAGVIPCLIPWYSSFS